MRRSIKIQKSIEDKVMIKLLNYLKSIHQINPEKNAKQLMDITGGFVSRFEYFVPLLNSSAKGRLLVSGCSVGSEMIVARQYGFKEIYGVEVTKEYVVMAKQRLINDVSFHVDFYDGKILPYPNNFFSTVCSGHIIEHTISPFAYIKEHMRVLKRGGFFYIEFPHRYHYKELHTGLWSYEWLPLPVRNYLLKKMFRKEPLYLNILSGVKPISIWQILLYCLFSLNICIPISIKRPVPGIIRMVIKKV